MSVATYMHRWFVSLLLTIYYSILVLVMFVTTYLKNPFSNPWALKLKLEPPTCLTDPKYGVHKYTKVNNIKLHYVESGDPSKPLMIFIHGFPELWYSWRHQIVEFQKDYWCVAFDMRGYGDSERPDGVSSYKLQLLIDDVRDLVKHLGREKCIIVAHDWGSLVACRFRDVYPDMVSGLAILAGCSREAFCEEIWNNPEQRKKSWYVFMFQAPALAEKMMQMNNMSVFDKTLLRAGCDSVTQQDVEAYKYWFGKQHTMTPPVNYYRANFEYTLPEKPRSSAKIPFLAIHPENDFYLNATLHDRMKNEYECIETTILKDCGHFCQQQEPAKVNQLIRDFLAKNNL
ncbi:epoxide hydrolase 3-like [Pectinophora gossypiella]|uniref:epoxide hydrolase 3-like n=1 Tax=Pectinophora gossypiella TaxID=13191 RepID=UPI00214DF55C|nr:epoxide hydrolase 3-like [Pectinophora gossypiella]